MRIHFLFVLFFLIGTDTYSQFGQQQIIATDAHLVGSVFSADIDGDGDQDVIAASRGYDTLTWHENDGQGNFGPPNLIDILYDTNWIRAADLDGDGDQDILSLSSPDDILVWYENLDGLGNFSSQIIISTEVDLPKEVRAADIDGDGDLDIISASKYDSKIAWYENMDGQGTFGSQQVITNVAYATVFATDIDGDGDLDIIGASPYHRSIFWYENLDGLGNFGTGNLIVETPNYGGFTCLFSIDIDNDGDQDVLSAEYGGNRIAWYENLDGNGSFSPQKVIDGNLLLPREIFSIDLDGDGDNDVLAPSIVDVQGNDLVVWYENTDGQGNFGPAQVVVGTLTFAISVHATDIDNDGDIDVISASQNEHTIAWYANQQIIGIGENEKLPLILYPNPSNDVLHIQQNAEAISKVEIFDLSGKKLRSFSSNIEKIDISDLASGTYLLKAYSGNKMGIEKIIKI